MAQQQQQSGDDGLAPVWITLLLFVTFYAIWYMGHKYIVSLIFHLNIAEAELVHLVAGKALLSKEIYIMKTVDPATISWSQLMFFSRTIGDYVRYPVVAILAVMAFQLYNSDIKLKFRRAHSMKSLRAQEQYNWPAIMPVVKLDLVSEDINTGPWAMALTPIEFARKHKLLRKDDVLLDNPVPGQEMTAAVRRGDAKRLFTLQLGPYWDGFDRCPAHARALAAIFMARINRDRASAQKIMETVDRTFAAGKPDYSVVIPILKKYQDSEIVQETLAKHAYLLTAMASLLKVARDDGVIASSEFLWLKPIDRRMWYMMNCVGRQTPYCEVGGPFAHWKAEIAIGRRCLVPLVDEAIKALEIAVKEIKLSPRELQGLEP